MPALPLRPSPTPDAMIDALLASVGRFAKAEIRSDVIDREARIAPRVLEGLAELGLFGMSIPERYGGSELSMRDVCAAVALLAQHDRSVATTVGLHLGLGTRGLVAFGDEPLKQAYLPRLASGAALAAFAATEPNAGSDLTALQTEAIPDGDGLRVRGEKAFVTNGGIAQVLTIVASTPALSPDRKGKSLILLERADPGVRSGREEHKLGLRGSSTTSLQLDDVGVPRSRVIGAAGSGASQLAHVLSWGRTVMAAGCVGAARVALEAAATHTQLRRQFGKALCGLDVVQEQLASLGALHLAMQATVDQAAQAQEDWPRLDRLSAVAKVFCSEGNWTLCDTALQLHGGTGFIEDSGLPRLLRDARVTRIFEGANDVLLTRLGAEEMTQPFHSGPTAVRPLGASAVARGAEELGWSVTERRLELKKRLGLRVFGHPRQLHRLGQLVVLRDATRALREDSPLALQWVQMARARAQPLLDEANPLEAVGDAAQAVLAEYAR